MKVTLTVETANLAAVDGSLGTTIREIVNDLKPEAAYFAEDKGQRTGFLVVNIKDPSQIPEIVEPWFIAFNASVELHPAMTLEDLGKGQAGIERAAQKYGSRLTGKVPKVA
jgi:hypothetical protein